MSHQEVLSQTFRQHDLRRWLPISQKEVKMRGWSEVDIIIFSGDAYVDHPSFASAVIGRVLEHAGYNVAIVPQPNWRDDLRDFKKLGRPRLFFGVSPGNMDSMVNHYTAARRRRSDDAYTPDERSDMRPDYPSLVYTKILRELYPDTPIILGGIEASLRRLTHYDYWQDKLLPGMSYMSDADLVVYGMGEAPIIHIARHLDRGGSIEELHDMPQVTYITPADTFAPNPNDITLNPHEVCLKDKKAYASNFRHIEEQSNALHPRRLTQKVGDQVLVVNPPYPLLNSEEMDAIYDLPYTRLPHPRYNGKKIRAYDMIKHSITMHRGCFGACAFCTISAHQGKFISSRSQQSIVNEAKKVTRMDDFKGYISDLGGPSANMYRMHGVNLSACDKCQRASCLYPKPCPNLNSDYTPLLNVYRAVDRLPGMKKSFVSSGIRYDLILKDYKTPELKEIARQYTEELIVNHISGRLKIAPEHTSERVLSLIRKPGPQLFQDFVSTFNSINRQHGLNQQLIPYFISSHPACQEEDMAELAILTKSMNFHLEQVQDFTPTPMTLATVIYYSGYNPYTLEKVYTAVTPKEKENQRQFFFWYKPEARPGIIASLRRIGREDLISRLFDSQIQNSKASRIRSKPPQTNHTAKCRTSPQKNSRRKGQQCESKQQGRDRNRHPDKTRVRH